MYKTSGSADGGSDPETYRILDISRLARSAPADNVGALQVREGDVAMTINKINRINTINRIN
ncbi:hypothetical protein [Jannaschia marina]|uniref:hypothetical protein n=1 Tax=Jannaschia marina TaxID=2741674 RepID=UPI0015CBC155|nr:hypothetical protein [Jannaschia marina]